MEGLRGCIWNCPGGTEGVEAVADEGIEMNLKRTAFGRFERGRG